jgi:hypothetical protein
MPAVVPSLIIDHSGHVLGLTPGRGRKRRVRLSDIPGRPDVRFSGRATGTVRFGHGRGLTPGHGWNGHCRVGGRGAL